jgi:hypothetical protein
MVDCLHGSLIPGDHRGGGYLAGVDHHSPVGTPEHSRTGGGAESERLRQEQLAACSAFAGALTELKCAVITLWFRRQESRTAEETLAAWVEADRLGAAVEAARFRVLLVLDDPSLAELADKASASITLSDRWLSEGIFARRRRRSQPR